MNTIETQRPTPAIIAALATIAATALTLGAIGAASKKESPATKTVTVRVKAADRIEIVKAPLEKPHGIGRRDMACIASAIWHEAGNQPREGRIAIAEVVITRTKSGIYPKRACAVIAQRSQFSFVERGRVPEVPAEHRDEMMRIAKGVVTGELHSRVRGAMYFHADYVNPGWKAPVVGRIGTHIFYGTSST